MMLRKWSLITIADHQGVMNLGGRLGAAGGPEAFESAFFRLNGRVPVMESLAARKDVPLNGSDIETNHANAIREISEAHSSTGLSVVVGGGHDHGFTHLEGVKRTLKPNQVLACINLDAHLDVRKPDPKIYSGSPFYLAIENKTIDPSLLLEFGIQDHCNAPELWEYVEKRGVPVVPMRELRHGQAVKRFQDALNELSRKADVIVISLDLDAVAAAHAPGVSAPQAEGFTASEIIEMMEVAGASKKVVSLGIFELNPIHDIEDKTAKLAATSAYHFLFSRLDL